MTDYRPVDCRRHSELEVAIMHRRRLRLAWRDAQGRVHVQVLLPRDLVTRDGAEFLVAGASPRDDPLELRLDRLLEATPADGD